MMSSRLASSVILLLAASTSIVSSSSQASVDDEQCLLQTRTEPKTRRSEHREEPREEKDQKTENLLGDEQAHGKVREEPREKIASAGQERAVPEFTINLDDAPETRFNEVSAAFKEPYDKFVKKYLSPNARKAARKAALFRGPESDAELMAEISGIAKATGVSVDLVQSAQLGGSLQTLKGPYFSYLHNMGMALPSDEKMADISSSPGFAKQFGEMTPSQIASMAPSFGCTGIIARDSGDGSVWHARNLDYGFASWAQNMTYNARFMKGGKEVFTGQMVFPFVMPFTAMRKGKNGYTYEVNSRYGDTAADAQAVFVKLFMEKRAPSGWTARKTLENVDNYEDAVKAFSTTPYPNREYNIISGVKKGTILAREPDELAYSLTLGPNDRYIIMTNFDYTKNDDKEFLKETRVKGLTPRVRAQKLLDDTNNQITPEFLQRVLDDEDVMEPNTLYQAMLNVETGTYQSKLPRCKECDCHGDDCVSTVNFLSEE